MDRKTDRGNIMQQVRLYSGDDGESHKEDIQGLFDGGGLQNAAATAAAEVVFVGGSGETSLDWHTAPRRQYLLYLSGNTEIEVASGDIRRFGPGDVLFAEDLTGRGHLTRSWGEDRRVVFVRLADDDE